MILELNDVILTHAERSVSLIAETGQFVCLTGGRSTDRTRLLRAILGFESLHSGIISIDGTPLTPRSMATMRLFMAYAPQQLQDEGRFPVYEAPTVQDMFRLKANREVSISNGILAEEMKRTECEGTAAQLLAVAGLLGRPIVLCDEPPTVSAPYLQSLTRQGRIAIVATSSQTLLGTADIIIEI